MSILVYLLDTLFFCLISAALLRAWLNAARIHMAQQPGPFLMALTDWVVKPLRRGLPPSWQRSRWDTASLTAAVLLAFAHALVWVLLTAHPVAAMGNAAYLWVLPVVAVKMLLRAALQGLLMLALGYAVLSWVQPQSPAYHWLGRLLGPLLQPIRRRLPLVGGVDLSALVFVLLLQVGLMLVG